MFQFLKSKKSDQKPPVSSSEKPKGWFHQLRSGLTRTRRQLTDNLSTLVLGKKTIDQTLLEELETLLLMADVGLETTEYLLKIITQKLARKELSDANALWQALKQALIALLEPCSQPLNIDHKPFIILMVGVNGAGKTTSIAKITHYYQQQNKRIMLAAGDTFRAAAVEQLKVWGERNQVPVISQQRGADSASVIYDAIEATAARQYDILIADTAGRLHTQNHLMEELIKIKRVIQKQNSAAPHEIMLVIDAGNGQNALNQAKQFHESIGLTGICLTKLDGTAKGGIIFAIANQLKLPIRFIGVGEGIDDLRPFNASEFVDALFDQEDNT